MTDPTPTAIARARPLSPHLSIYRPQLTSSLSIFQKITGIGLAGGLIVFLAWLVALALGPEAFALVNGLCVSVVGQILFLGWMWAVCYHVCNAVRFLLWSVGACLSLPAIYATGYAALAVSTLATFGLWGLVHGQKVLAWL
jgi:succinate dehydrogenase / fumarate reductase cytochrome b subunit